MVKAETANTNNNIRAKKLKNKYLILKFFIYYPSTPPPGSYAEIIVRFSSNENTKMGLLATTVGDSLRWHKFIFKMKEKIKTIKVALIINLILIKQFCVMLKSNCFCF